MRALQLLLLFIPASLLAHWAGTNEIFVFASSALAIIPQAKLLGEATEVLVLGFSMFMGGLKNGRQISALVSLDGESNWLEGAMLLAVYGILSLAFFFLPLKL